MGAELGKIMVIGRIMSMGLQRAKLRQQDMIIIFYQNSDHNLCQCQCLSYRQDRGDPTPCATRTVWTNLDIGTYAGSRSAWRDSVFIMLSGNPLSSSVKKLMFVTYRQIGGTG